MLPSYDDVKLLFGKPRWYDEHGVPRYCDFHPDKCGVYNVYVALCLIGCQSCKKTFLVAVERDSEKSMWGHPIELPTPTSVRSFHYGDPPHHGCVGDSMNCETRAIKEFWEIPSGAWAWQRNNKHEHDYGPTGSGW